MTLQQLEDAIGSAAAEIQRDESIEDVTQAMIDHYNWLYNDDIKTGFRKTLICIS